MEDSFNTLEPLTDIEENSKFNFKFCSIYKKTAYIAGAIIILLIVLIVIILVSVSGVSKNKDNSDNTKNTNNPEIPDNPDKQTETTCEQGEEDLCKKCDGNKCVSCNDKYNLVNGVCEPMFDIKSIYTVNSYDEKVTLFNEPYNEYITQMEVDGQNVTPSNNYKFPQLGNHTIYYSIKNEQLDSFSKMFYQIDKLTSILFTKKLDTKNIVSMERMFVHCNSLTFVDMSHFNIENVKNLDYFMYDSNNLVSLKLPKSRAQNLEKANHMFSQCQKLTSIDFTNFTVNSKNLTEFHGAFKNCYQLEYVNLTNFNFQEATDMDELFFDCHSLKSIDFPDMRTNKLKTMNKIFYGCNSLKSLNLSNFNTENVVDMNYLFYNCSSLVNIDVSSFNTKNVQYMTKFFYGCSSLVSVDLSNFNTEKVLKLNGMFEKCTHLSYIDISNFSNNAQNYFEFFTDLPAEGTIKLNMKIYEKIQNYIPSNWEKKYVD